MQVVAPDVWPPDRSRRGVCASIERVRRGSVIAALLALLSSCGWGNPSALESPPPTAEPWPSPQAPAAVTPGPRAVAGLSGPARFVLRLTDQNGMHPGGIPVRITGSRNATLVSDDRGEVEISEAGSYELAPVKGCHELLEVEDAGAAKITLPANESHTEEVELRWRHRFAPAGPAISSTVRGNWRMGMEVRYRYPVKDRCNGDAITPGAAYPTFRFKPSEAIEVVGTPELVSRDDGYAWVRVRCVKPGTVLLIAEDGANPSDSINIATPTIEGRRPRCLDEGPPVPPS